MVLVDEADGFLNYIGLLLQMIFLPSMTPHRLEEPAC